MGSKSSSLEGITLQLENYGFIDLQSGQPTSASIAERNDLASLQVIYPEKKASSRALVIVLPGGGYINLAPHEGLPVAEWLAQAGYTAMVLRYRRGSDFPHPVPLQDAQKAMRLVRSFVKENLIDASKIGVLGFSAGGHLASTLATHFAEAGTATEAAELRPDFQILVYPVITMSAGGHEVSRLNLLGADPAPEQIELLSNEKHVSAQTPPAFLFHSTKDQGVPVFNSDLYVASLKAAGVPFEYIRGEFGGHGIGLKPFWGDPCLSWLSIM